MKYPYHDIIQFYEQERTFLESSIQEYVNEYEYLMADYCQRGLYQVKNLLEILYHLTEVNYEKRKELMRRIEVLKGLYNKQNSEIYAAYYEDEIKKIGTRNKFFA